MPRLIVNPTVVPAVGTPPKRIEEYVGMASTQDREISIARMVSPSGWTEPGQRPEFRELTYVFCGSLHVAFEGGELDVHGGEAVIVEAGEWVQYSTPGPIGAEYLAICLPAFTPDTVHRDA